MTKSTITRERLEELASGQSGFNLRIATLEESQQLARMALAALYSEPVAYTDERNLGYIDRGRETAYLWGKQNSEASDVALYRHAQPATASEPLAVTDDELNAALQLHRLKVDGHSQLSDAFRAGFRYARRTTPQPAPVVNGEYGDAYQGAREDLAIWKRRALEAEESVRRLEQINDHLVKEAQGESRMGEPVIAQPAPVAPVCTCPSGDGSLRWPCPVHPGNSPVIPDVMLKIGYMFITAEGGTAFSISDVPVPGMTLAGPVYAPAVKAGGQQNAPQNIPEIISGWIPVSERMPEDDDFVYIWPRPDFGVELHVGQYCEFSPKGDGWYAQVYEQNYGIEWHPITVTHWMPLPAAPQEDINALIPLVSRNEQEGK
ncbi:Protein of uncharacterised function (DUF551) [Klebsiella pneumoniae]|uniref:DUF551 domain-containing protein n=1 Tax=Klebsiella pneumoniae TaxID=573 RepID=UPI000657C6E3|nr:DUF551 domain-containing protein [Klebsiella pneumoniae]KMG75040.1 hypothetical protein SM58_00513 [Klebsiella pneumoniae]SXA57146.1 Protein of uncharacterised function (DUF551) [Klebsiella pneumoniae]